MRKHALVIVAMLLVTLSVVMNTETTFAATTNKNISLRTNKRTCTLSVGKSATIKAIVNGTVRRRNVYYKSLNKKVATVSSKGVITAKAPGKTYIRIRYRKKNAYCKVTVTNKLMKISLNEEYVEMDVGKTKKLKPTFTPQNPTNMEPISWTSTNSRVASVSHKGVIEANSPGIATITVRSGKKKATCRVLVTSLAPTPKVEGTFISTKNAFAQLNQFRIEDGKTPLKNDKYLEAYAKIRAVEIVKKFSHTRPSGGRGLALIPGNLYKAENLAYGQRSERGVMAAWYKSEGHRDVMLWSPLKKAGMACYEYDGTRYWVTLFSS